jgi:hypothetical protein
MRKGKCFILSPLQYCSEKPNTTKNYLDLDDLRSLNGDFKGNSETHD